jgi:hypothetical protein
MPRFNKVRCDYLYVGRSGEFSARKLSADGVDAGQSGTAGIVKSFPATAAKGHLALTGVANDGDTATTISNAAMGQASVISIPDPGAATANFLLTSQGNDKSLVTATAAEINAVADVSAKIVAQSAGNFSLGATHVEKITVIADADVVITLPSSTGNYESYTIMIGATGCTSGLISVSDTDTFLGGVVSGSVDADAQALGYCACAAAHNEVNLTAATGGNLQGDWIKFTSVVENKWYVEGVFIATGTEASPFDTAA